MQSIQKERTEQELASMIKEAVGNITNPIVVDIGASGFYSAASLLVQEGWKGVLYEPHPVSYNSLLS